MGAFAAAAFEDPERFHGHEIDLAAEPVTLVEVADKIEKVRLAQQQVACRST
ncbi:hypothetical protein [Achromobacter marplatensis]|uniref:hypothetical protein n=1 Tax=Achromobacter marplatensis TaxID=470868 RepID=UPI0035E61BEE